MANIGVHLYSGEYHRIDGVVGVNDNDVVIQYEAAERFNDFTLMSVAGVMEVDVSLDGTNFASIIALEDKASTTPATRVLITVAGQIYRFQGTFKAIKVRQASATAVTGAELLCSRLGA